MSAVNDLMIRLLGTNWKTTVTAWATALSSLAAVILVAYGNGKLAIIAGTMSAISKVLNGLVAADATPSTPSVKSDPPAIEPGSGGNSGGASFVMLCVVAAASLCVILSMTGCTTPGMRRVQGYTDKAAKSSGISWLPSWLGGFRKAEGEIYAEQNGLVSTQGMTTVSRAWAADEHRWITGKVQRIKVMTSVEDVLTGEPLPAPEIVIPIPTNTTVPPATEPTSASSTNTTAGGGTTLSDKVGNL